MPDGVAGFDVISVVRRRRNWTSEQKLSLVKEVDRPGSFLAAVADRHGVSRSLLFEWRRQLREGMRWSPFFGSPALRYWWQIRRSSFRR